MSNLSIPQSGGFSLSHIGWRYYSQIRKRAMDQEFTWGGLVLNLSIAFFIVIMTTFFLSFINHSVSFVNAAERKIIPETYQQVSPDKVRYIIITNYQV